MSEDSEIITGRNPVFEALKAGRPINKILLGKNSERHRVIGQILHIARQNDIPIEYTTREAITRVSRTSAHQGVVACTAVKEYVDVETLLQISKEKDEPAFIVVLDGIEDPHNLGAILRTVDAAGAHGVIIRSRRATGLTAAAGKASAGAIEYVPVARVSNINQYLLRLKKENIWIAGIEHGCDKDYSAIDLALPIAIVIGSEGRGLSNPVKKSCDFLVSIPMFGKINSLNASIAAAVMMYEVVKQRKPAANL